MKLNAYTLYDVKSLSYSPPFFTSFHAVAVRMVADLASDLTTTVGRHPADYTLFCIGAFDDATGQLLSADVREHVTDVLPLVEKPNDNPLFTRSASGMDYYWKKVTTEGK